MNDKIGLLSGYGIEVLRTEDRPDRLILVLKVQPQDPSDPSKFEIELDFSQAIQLAQSLRESAEKILKKDVH